MFIIGMLAAGLGTSCGGKTPRLGQDPPEAVVAAMTLEEKALLVTGTGALAFAGGGGIPGATGNIIPGAAGMTHGVARLGVTPVVLADGPAGVNIAPTREGSAKVYRSTAFPVGTLLASTWDAQLVEDVGRAMGNEALEYGIDILLSPALNIQRNPLGGRNFEYYSEDPVVSGRVAGAMIRGIQANGVGASAKHFAANNQETNRVASDSKVSQRALREIYLKGFELAVKDAEPWTVMTSYNLLNGTYTSENRELLGSVLRDEWHFASLVMTDWMGGQSAARMIRAGNDLLMPGFEFQREEIIAAAHDGSLDPKFLDACAARVLELVARTPRFRNYKYSDNPDLAAHAAIARRAAAEGMVLLKNGGKALPFAANTKTIAAYGLTSYDFIRGGTGSGDVNGADAVSLVEGLENAGYVVDGGLRTFYEARLAKLREKKAAQPKPDDMLAPLKAPPRPGEIIPAPAALSAQADTADFALITIGRQSGEMVDRQIDDDFNLTGQEQKLIAAVSGAFHAKNKKVVVLLNIGGVVETSSWKMKPDAILLAWQGGREAGNAVADILSGRVNPSGKLTATFPVKYLDEPSALNFPHDFKLTGSLSEAMTPRGRSANPVRNTDYTLYEEDIYVGYRYFDSFDKPVSYPFGYGLSYTEFGYGGIALEWSDEESCIVSVKVTNIGKVSGKEVVQLYVAAPANPDYPKPKKELKAFAKTRELAPGESLTLKMTVTKYDLASFDPKAAAWVTDAGIYAFLLCASSASVKGTVKTHIAERRVYPAHNVLNPEEPLKAPPGSLLRK